LDLNKPYAQDFDTLKSAKEDQSYKWENDKTIAGWFSSRDTYRVSNGGNFQVGLYSFGAKGKPDRALGAVVVGTQTVSFGADFQNATGRIITALSIQYAGEQWRLGSAGEQTLAFYTSASGNPLIGGDRHIKELDFTSLKENGTGEGKALDGNALSVKKSFTLRDLEIYPDGTFDITWKLTSPGIGSSQGLAVDDFKITVEATEPVMGNPEPSTLALVASAALTLAGWRWLRKRKQAGAGDAAQCP
jgi:hypothetical protein